jgi:hypothetical protein
MIMGWTHSWKRPTELPPGPFAAAVSDCVKVLNASNVELAGMEGNGKPVFLPDTIVFNGVRPEHCEPFEIHRIEFDRRGRELFWSSCKTNRARYDICVMASLIVFRHHFEDRFQVASDGPSNAWKVARELCVVALGYGQGFQLSE